MGGRTDPELLRQLDAAWRTGASVAAVVRLKQSGKLPDAADVEARTEEAIRRACDATGESPEDVHVMGRIGVAYVTGPARFVRELVEQPEVTGAVANNQPAP